MIVERGADGLLHGVGEDAEFVLKTHEEQADCIMGCVVHNPQMSHMSYWAMNWREDRGMMERICPHGIGHPDYDQVRFWTRTMKWQDAWAEMTHSCDGCC